MILRTRSMALVALMALGGTAVAQQTASVCGSLANAYGPYDYRSADKTALRTVEGPHFPPKVEALLGGVSGTLGAEIDYTLRAFPNHHRALLAVMRYGEKMKTPQPADLRYPVECYFERALRFRRDDVVARMLFVQFLTRQKRAQEAMGHLAVVAEEAKDNPLTHYNLGLLYFDLQRYDESLVHAQKAYELGIERPELRDQLKKVGKTIDMPARAPISAASAGAASSPSASAPAASAAAVPPRRAADDAKPRE